MAKAKVNQVHYDKYHLHDVLADAQVANGKIHATLDSKNDLLNGVIAVSALADTKKLQATLVAECAPCRHVSVTGNP